MKYRKKPVEIEAIVWDGTEESFNGIAQLGCTVYQDDSCEMYELIIPTLEDGSKNQVKHIASKGDYIIKGLLGEFYPCKPDIFQLSYEPVVDIDNERGLYCIEVEREQEDMYVFHQRFDHEPSIDEVLASIVDEDLNYDDDYGRFNFYKVG